MKTKNEIIRTNKEVTKRYYINLTNNNSMKKCYENIGINTDCIIDTYVDDNNKLVIITNEIIETYEKVEVIKNYEKVGFITPISFANYYHKVVAISIINSMANSSKSWNNKSCMQIVNNHYNDNLMDDIFQCALMTIYSNLKRFENDSIIDKKIYFNCLFKKYNNTNFWDTKSNDFIMDKEHPCNTIWLACYRSISRFISNQKTSIDNKEVCIIDYDNKDKEDIILNVNTQAYNQYCINQFNNISLDSIDSFYDIIDNVKFYIATTEKSKVSTACKSLINYKIQGYKLKDIQNFLDLSETTITKYNHIVKNAFYKLYKKPINHSDNSDCISVLRNYFDSFKHYGVISIDFTNCSNIEKQQIDNIIDKCNSYYHAKKQAMYNELFHALPYDNKSMVVRCKMVEAFYRHELQIDRQF